MDKPTLDKKQTMAERYDAGEDLEFTVDNESLEFETRACGHTGNCPCARNEHDVDAEFRIFEDGSVWVDADATGPFKDLEAAKEAVIEAAQDRALDPYDGPDWDEVREMGY